MMLCATEPDKLSKTLPPFSGRWAWGLLGAARGGVQHLASRLTVRDYCCALGDLAVRRPPPSEARVAAEVRQTWEDLQKLAA
jgi:hypothetical protein